MTGADVPAVAALYAAREGRPPERAVEVVSGWPAGSDDPDRIALVACRDGVVRAYAKAERLDPAAVGGDAPAGWYLTGLVVDPPARRHGLGRLLTEERIRLLAGRGEDVWCFANISNRPTIALHEQLGFTERTRDFRIPGVTFAGGRGVLLRRAL
ncbi:MAG: GNAT family N-acetyltransferase [Nocardioidaceae bacterium]|nr:GNAT family N-acetyltransferase [Nocardioidaceae bacterium]MCL2614445.1 GNAT family N-acetyltransferase [Nocardioidaceae bacterium]